MRTRLLAATSRGFDELRYARAWKRLSDEPGSFPGSRLRVSRSERPVSFGYPTHPVKPDARDGSASAPCAARTAGRRSPGQSSAARARPPGAVVHGHPAGLDSRAASPFERARPVRRAAPSNDSPGAGTPRGRHLRRRRVGEHLEHLRRPAHRHVPPKSTSEVRSARSSAVFAVHQTRHLAGQLALRFTVLRRLVAPLECFHNRPASGT